ncbi:MAG: SDR family oxidoreductase [Pseudomonadales bacterium]|nr:SDR family oxidoreductase [Pseudomonadales bacterium]
MIDLIGHNVLVTGSTQGVGQAIVVAMAQAGANVVLHGLHDDEAAQTAIQQCRSTGVDAHLLTLDLATHVEQASKQIFQEARQLNPNIDILVNNAGTCIDQPFLEMDFATFDRTMQLNVYAGFFLTQRFSQQWVQDSINGRVLFIGSINGKLAEPIHSAYDTSKGAVESMVKTLAVSLAPHNIRVNGLAPGLFYTPLTAPALDDPDFMQWMQNHTPNGRVPGPEVCGDGAVYLVSDAAQHVCGHMLMVDGGMSIWQQPDPS